MTKDERAALMPVVSKFWREFVAEFGPPAEFHGYENGEEIHWVPSKPSTPPQ